MIINSQRCIITELKATDFQEAVDLFFDEKVRQYLGGIITKEVALDKLNSWINSEEELYFCVRISESGAFVGIISITEHHDKEFMELSYQFLPEFWGRGIAGESIRATLDFLRNNSAVKELVAETQNKNLGSCQLLEKLGFEYINTTIRFGEEQKIYKFIM